MEIVYQNPHLTINNGSQVIIEKLPNASLSEVYKLVKSKGFSNFKIKYRNG